MHRDVTHRFHTDITDYGDLCSLCQKGRAHSFSFSGGKIRENRRDRARTKLSRSRARGEGAIVSDEFIRISLRLVGNDLRSHALVSVSFSLSLSLSRFVCSNGKKGCNNPSSTTCNEISEKRACRTVVKSFFICFLRADIFFEDVLLSKIMPYRRTRYFLFIMDYAA